MNRRRVGGNTALFFFALVGSGCADPKGDFDSYIDRTNGIRGVIPEGGIIEEDTGPVVDTAIDTPPFDANVDVTGTFFMSCNATLLAGDASKTLLFYTEFTDSGGKLSFNVYPLSETATKFAKSETVGTPQVATMVPVNPMDGTWKTTIGTTVIPGSSQRISDNDLKLENLSYNGRIVSQDRLCAELDGQLVAPFVASFDGPGDICIFVRMAEGADLPMSTQGATTYVGYKASEHHCP
ncbi:MAG: hypothetical protein ACXWUG_21305 [Polyangiales bacterium]